MSDAIPTMTDSLTPTLPSPVSLDSLSPQALIGELVSLRQQRTELDRKILEIISKIKSEDVTRPLWGPCTRCGHTWHGISHLHIPVACARCGSSYWNRPPLLSTARSPLDPPSPNWKTSAERRKDKLVKQVGPKRPVGRPRKYPRKEEAAAPVAAPTPVSTPTEFRRSLPTPTSDPIFQSPSVVAPPPRLFIPSAPMVPPPSVRFAEDAPQPERAAGVHLSEVREWPTDGVPVNIEPNGDITIISTGPTEAPVIKDDELSQVEQVVADANAIPIGVDFRGDHPPIEPDAADPSVDYVQDPITKEWKPKGAAND